MYFSLRNRAFCPPARLPGPVWALCRRYNQAGTGCTLACLIEPHGPRARFPGPVWVGVARSRWASCREYNRHQGMDSKCKFHVPGTGSPEFMGIGPWMSPNLMNLCDFLSSSDSPREYITLLDRVGHRARLPEPIWAGLVRAHNVLCRGYTQPAGSRVYKQLGLPQPLSAVLVRSRWVSCECMISWVTGFVKFA